MSGPYDIYGDYASERSVSSHLPFGLGGDGVMSWAPELALWGIGSLTFRYGIKTGLSGTASSLEKGKLRYSAHQERVANKVARTFSKGGNSRAVAGRGAKAIFDSQVRHKTRVEAIETRGRRVGHGRGAPQRQRVRRTDYHRIRGSKSVVKSAESVAKAGSIWTQSMRGSRIAQIGQSLKGWGVAIGSAQLGAFAMDIGASIGHATVDWRPRRESHTQFEFGGNTYSEIGGAYTQRQRAIMAIHDSQLTSMAAIGGEAAFMHM